MFKKILIIIIGLILLLLISFAVIHEVSSAAGENIIIKTCEIKKLNDYLSLIKNEAGYIGDGGEGFKNLINSFNNSDGYGQDIKVRIAFEKAREQYHETMRCVFDIASVQILGSAAKLGDNLRKNEIPDLTKALGDLNDAGKVCALADTPKFKEILTSGGPSELVKPLLEAYNNYSAFINYLIESFKYIPIDDNGSSSGFGEYGEKYLQMRLIMGNEIQDSIVALDAAFQSLKEMRIAFVMHVRFECMLQNLQFYQKMMKNIRSIVSAIPSAIEDASMHK